MAPDRQARATDLSDKIGPLTKAHSLFGFAQFEFAGTLAVADGRYVVRDGEEERVLVIQTLGAPPPPRRRRRRPREAEPDREPAALPVTRVTVVRAFAPFGNEDKAKVWLKEAGADEEEVDRLVGEGIGVLNRALHAHAVASGDPHAQAMTPARAIVVRIGYGSGAEVAEGAFSAGSQIDPGGGAASLRQRRAEELRPQERLAAVLGERERIDACETLLLRARADLDAGRTREAALQLRVGLEALMAELRDALTDPGHEEDMGTLTARRHEAGELANAALSGDLNPKQLTASGRAPRALRARPPPPPRPTRLRERWRATTSSSRDSAISCASASSMPSRDGTPITVRPAARAAATPVGESSSATTRGPASTPSRRQASK